MKYATAGEKLILMMSYNGTDHTPKEHQNDLIVDYQYTRCVLLTGAVSKQAAIFNVLDIF